MKIRSVGTELFSANRRTGRRDAANSRFFAILRKRPKIILQREVKTGCRETDALVQAT